MHQLLLRDLGHAIEVPRLLDDARYARDVLLVCDGLASPELKALAQHFRHPEQVPEMPPAAAPGHTLQPAEWGADTSGFGVTQPPPLPGPAAAAPPPAPVVERRRAWLGSWRRS